MFSIKSFAVISMAMGASVVSAQRARTYGDRPQAEIAVSYSFMRVNAAPGQCGCFNLNGGSTEAAIPLFRRFSMVADFTGEHSGTTSIPGQSLSLILVTGGPRFTYFIGRHGAPRVSGFVQGLVGAAHGFDAPFPSSASSTSVSATSLAVLAGGGFDVSISRKFAIRPVQLDYGLTHLPNNVNDRQNLLKVSAGLVFRIK